MFAYHTRLYTNTNNMDAGNINTLSDNHNNRVSSTTGSPVRKQFNSSLGLVIRSPSLSASPSPAPSDHLDTAAQEARISQTKAHIQRIQKQQDDYLADVQPSLRLLLGNSQTEVDKQQLREANIFRSPTQQIQYQLFLEQQRENNIHSAFYTQ
eukprot:TRINITY_DN1855_c0_g1_i1.p1 TRINITY_DN1855_c0_g1~~TRINITY_DN1855_c0_g1_i1.p1  ORF type:complete len:153 (-),score=44.25 TRINITY_DN1855_c0_g1_i1:100-558(-)